MEELNYRQKKFCREYIKNKHNATRAALKAGYSKSYSKVDVYRLLENPSIQEYIEKLTKDGTDIELMDVLQELKTLSFSKITDYLEVKDGKVEFFDTGNISEEAIPAIKKIKQKIKLKDTEQNIELEYELYDKVKSLELLGSQLGMFTGRIEHTGEIGVKIVDDLSD